MLSYDDFIATRKAASLSESELDNLGLEPEQSEVLLYDDNCFIMCLPDGRFHLCIEAYQNISKDLDYLEGILYHRWYAPNNS